MAEYLILGCGYTASRVAQRLVATGARVICTNRRKVALAGADCLELDLTNEQSLLELKRHLSKGMVVLNSIPVFEGTAMLLNVLRDCAARRVVYLSTTGVYGLAEFVDERTPTAAESQRDRERVQTEQLIFSGPWTSLVLRPAAIYGPGRGIHMSAISGIFRLPPGGHRLVSRIHVDDLAECILAALDSELTGAYPVADETPATSAEVAAWAFALLDKHFEAGNLSGEDGKKGRSVDGSAVRRALGVQLRYSSFHDGVAACLRHNAI